jgi:GGDEF domain-containing protein
MDSGIATCPADGADVDSLIRLADLRLYEQKRKRKLLKSEWTGEK